MRGDFIETATLRIHRFLPPALLPHENIEDLDFDRLAMYLARAQYMQDLEIETVARAINEVFAE
ncbi:hypothetical protein LJC32_02690 [Oscillospiraceae bacterium OttesenSCG-928-F05]|nr:hypothetical protein [Oscillospiraceae bacterium OttesenSCG-928-F05]